MTANQATVGASSFVRALRSALAVLLLGGTVLVALHYWLGVGRNLDFAIGNVVYDAVVLGAGVACIVRASLFGRERSAWLLIGASILVWGAAEVYWTVAIEGNPNAPYPSPADIGYLLFYPLAYAGIGLLVRARAHEINWRLWMDGVIAALGTAALGAAFVFDFVAEKTEGTPIQKITTMAYPLGDIGMLALVVGVVALTGWRPGRTWSLLLAGLAALVVADIAYTLQSIEEALPGGSWVEPIYLIAAVCLGASVWQPTEAADITSPVEVGGRREIVVPAVFASVMIGLFAMQYFSATSGLSTILWAATMTAVIVRLAMSDKENKVLLEEVRTDQLTGLGNRGRLQVDLPAHLARASEEKPVLLLLFDLNGFKHFNDTFGHPAGDELLTKLGGQLRDALGDGGVAYRIGGDEFCVLLTCARERFDALTLAATAALSATGPGYEVGASWGAVEAPREESEPKPAMQLADVRMYAQKESRRLAGAEAGEEQIESAADLDAHQVRVIGPGDQHRRLV
ncbi:MAG TPA: GGDEF domain-containing protein [Solirubrobacterales bacterium]|nr:GGDEF domain-containing protein [Solirubrobacterales bacterium]